MGVGAHGRAGVDRVGAVREFGGKGLVLRGCCVAPGALREQEARGLEMGSAGLN